MTDARQQKQPDTGTIQILYNYDCTQHVVYRYKLLTSRFSGKEQDNEGGLDNFGFATTGHEMGRFMTPDYWGDDDGPPGPLPYGDLNDPQSLNLYGYVRNNPLSRTDSDGHDCIYNNGDGTGYVQRGDCTSDTDSGVFINGTINVNSFNYNAANNSSSFSYTTESGGLGTGLLQGPDLNGGFDADSLGAVKPGDRQDVPRHATTTATNVKW